MKKFFGIVFLMALLVGLSFIAKAEFNTYGGHTVTEVLAAQQFYSATTGAVTYSNDIDLNEYTGTIQGIKSFALGSTPSTACNIKLQSASLAVGESYTTVGSTDNILLSGATTNAKLAASFTQSGVAQVKSVQLKLKQIGTVADVKLLTVGIYADSSGPTGSALATATTILAKSVGKDGYVPVLFTFATPYDLANNTKYWIVISPDYDASGTNAIEWRSNTVSSGGNYASYTSSSWVLVSTKSLEFTVNQYQFADVAGGAFTAVTDTAGNGIEVLGINKDGIGRFIRTKMTLTGSYPTFIGCLMINGQQKEMK